MKRKIAITLMSAGIILIGLAAVLLVYNNYENQKAQEYSGRLIHSIKEDIASNELKDKITDPFDEEMKIKEIDGYGYIGYLSIPALNLDLPVMSEWDYGRLKISPCRYYGSTKTDNLVVAAHNYRAHFGYLGNLKPGDTVVFTDMDAVTHNYKVDSVDLLMPTDVDKVKDAGDDLILYTCTYGGKKRIIVRCNYVE